MSLTEKVRKALPPGRNLVWTKHDGKFVWAAVVQRDTPNHEATLSNGTPVWKWWDSITDAWEDLNRGK